MATSLDNSATGKTNERRQRVLLSPLADDFLRIPGTSPRLRGNDPMTDPATGLPLTPQQIQERMDQQTALALHQQLNAAAAAAAPTNIRGRLLISVMQAKLVKNYGMTRMDPYVRLHIGHNIYETPTDVNGSKTPRWNKCINCFLPHGIHQIYLEIYDECSFSVDELVAHAYIQIPEQIFKGETVEDWYPLSGKQGEGKEGQILLVFSFMQAPVGVVPPGVGPMLGQSQLGFVPGGGVVAAGYPPQQVIQGGTKKQPQVFQSNQHVSTATTVPPQTSPQRPTFDAEDFKQLREMFPNMDEDVVKSVYEAAGFNKQTAVNSLLSMIAD